jgi:hypothetical protein
VLLKVELQDVYFALYVDDKSPPLEFEAVLAQYGQQHATKICASRTQIILTLSTIVPMSVRSPHCKQYDAGHCLL